MRAEFSIVLGRREGVVSVPRAAIQGEPSARFVYVQDFDLPTVFVKTPVVVGEMNDRFAEVVVSVAPSVLSLVLGVGGSSSRMIRRISSKAASLSASESKGVVPVSSSYSRTPSA